MKKLFYLLTAVILLSVNASAQEHHMNMQMHDSVQQSHKQTSDTVPQHNMQHTDMNNMDMHNDTMPMNNHTSMHNMHRPMMSSMFSRSLPMNRNGSGTGWLPDASPMYGNMYHSKHWMYMLHGSLFLRYNNQDFTGKGLRGGDRFDTPDWIMLMGQRNVGNNGLFGFSTMFSLDAVTANSGYPLLFQSGEAYKGKPLVDKQHPHDFFSELTVSYTQALSKKTDVFVYVGYPGEPALGPVTFMHRPSALDNPNAPLSHHWADATHITFGVATLGVRYGMFKLEGSSFTGREPDEHRFNFDKPRFDSWSGRLSFNPSVNWALQVSHGYIDSPEELHPGENVNRTTASASYSNTFNKKSIVNATALWGMNKSKDHKGENAALLEASWRKNRLALYMRYEFVQKSVEELDLDKQEFGDDALFNVNALTAGINYDLFILGKLHVAAGGQYTIYSADSKLDNLYGKNPMSYEFYIRIYPGIMRMKM